MGTNMIFMHNIFAELYFLLELRKNASSWFLNLFMQRSLCSMPNNGDNFMCVWTDTIWGMNADIWTYPWEYIYIVAGSYPVTWNNTSNEYVCDYCEKSSL